MDPNACMVQTTCRVPRETGLIAARRSQQRSRRPLDSESLLSAVLVGLGFGEMAADIHVEGATIKAGISKALFDSRAALNGGLGMISYPYAVLRNGQQLVVATAEAEVSATPLTVIGNWTAGLPS